jgi:hypothetical protein
MSVTVHEVELRVAGADEAAARRLAGPLRGLLERGCADALDAAESAGAAPLDVDIERLVLDLPEGASQHGDIERAIARQVLDVLWRRIAEG